MFGRVQTKAGYGYGYGRRWLNPACLQALNQAIKVVERAVNLD
jgi:hypothetical protein